MSYLCPLCHQPLTHNGQAWFCEQNHHFDCAKEGYVHLLPVQHKHSKLPGDSKAMMQARRRFLDQGYYAPMRSAVISQLIKYFPQDINYITYSNKKIFDSYTQKELSILDIGCGEGYYTSALPTALQQISPATLCNSVDKIETESSQNISSNLVLKEVRSNLDSNTQVVDNFDEISSHSQEAALEKIAIYGLDISKEAIRTAAKRYKQVQFVVASSHRLPFADRSMAAVIRIYAPCNSDELARVIVPSGILITVTPAAKHLHQLKSLIYSELKLHPDHLEDLPDFTLLESLNLSYPMSLTGESAYHLLQMTPFFWRASDDLKLRLQAMAQFTCDADFMIRVYRRHEDDPQ